MDYQTYRDNFFTSPTPEQRFIFKGLHGTTLFYADYADAVMFYQQVLGEPAYVEGEYTRGWQIGETWLTLLKSKDGNPQNVEVMVVMQTPQEVDKLAAAMARAGAKGGEPEDQLMYEPVHLCSVVDPFGVNFMISCQR
ncbi:MAG: hypothetical protein MUO40_07245 [Anaerolineaceae bacterium]|nr:hypothetical protein [Anaerolineaceae bacterium]